MVIAARLREECGVRAELELGKEDRNDWGRGSVGGIGAHTRARRSKSRYVTGSEGRRRCATSTAGEDKTPTPPPVPEEEGSGGEEEDDDEGSDDEERVTIGV